MISILFENEDVVAVDKPEGLAVIPERNRTAGSLVEVLSAQRAERLYVVHRIDKDTSGVVVLARTARAHRWLNQQFEARSVQKTYLALVHGVVAEGKGVIDRPLRPFGSGRIGVDWVKGKPSMTEYRVVKRFDATTLVQAFPKTGRRHQIRVHLYSIDHPIVGDRVYGDRATQKRFARLMLHARKIAFSLSSGTDLTVEAPTPESFQSVLSETS